ncbi:glycosyltransferase family 4 protein [Halorubrum sp. AD140]|uniref:glycosyltransferase family 4 protein n=1 Tax=Halorubrum sp. AD140 TaxID=3050073 RepID=UPI002ACCBD58|nr:glycosyltransferase family 4 protein [Halorubrum sp. AD140]MDZ5810492.1 glycosyltransferase family 4 protein [Halorubrum sp. AD140]
MGQKITVCFVSDTLHSYFGSGGVSGTGGAERQQYILATNLADRGKKVSVATLAYDRPKRITKNDIDVWRIIPDVRGLLRAPYKALRTIFGLSQINADVYYVRGNDFLCMVTAAYATVSESMFVYAVANDTNVDPETLANKGIFRRPFVAAMSSADLVIAQNQHQASLLKSEHGIDPTLIPNGYDLPSESMLVDHDQRRHVLWVGSMDPDQKKPLRFLELARRLPNTQFRMIGPPDNDRPKYYETVEAEANSIDNVEFLGYVDPDEIHDHYRDAIALVNTSDYEGFPNVYLEAWRYATPVVSLYHDLDGILTEENVGVQAGSMDALVDSVRSIATDESLCETLGNSGRAYMANHFSLEQLVDRYERALESVFTDST